MQPYYQSISPTALQGNQLDTLLALGWFRMHQNLFTTSHIRRGVWHRVHWLRFPVAAIEPRRSHARIRKKMRPWRIVTEPAATTVPEAYEQLYSLYFASIDFDGAESVAAGLFGDAPPGRSVFQTHCISVFDDHRLIAAGYFDVGLRAAASILHFYHPGYSAHSLGKALMLITLDYLRQQQIEFYYPGYVVEGDGKMNYKLFLGAGAAQYFDPETVGWRPFCQLPGAGIHFGIKP